MLHDAILSRSAAEETASPAELSRFSLLPHMSCNHARS